MSFFKAMDISSSGLASQRVRMNVLSSNLANAQTTRTPEGGPYKRQDVVFEAAPASDAFSDYLDDSMIPMVRKAKINKIHEDQKPPRMVYEPHHPEADENGYVKMPNIQVMSEMVNMITATRAYEANATALNEAKQMATKALEIGR